MADEFLPAPDDEPAGHDWEAIERLYRAGMLSVREIARRHGLSDMAVRKRAARDAWERDLSARVQEAVRNSLVRAEVRANPEKDDEVIEAAASRAVAVVVEHRGAVARMRGTVAALQARLDDLLANQSVAEALAAAEPNGAAKVALVRATSLAEQARTLDKMANTLSRLIPLERQAHGIDDRPQDSGPTAQQQQLRDAAYGVVLDMLAERAKAKRAAIDDDYSAMGGSTLELQARGE